MKKLIINDVLELEYSEIKEVKKQLKKFNIVIKQHVVLGDIVYLSSNVEIGTGCNIGDEVFIGENSKIEGECVIGNHSVIEENVKIESGVTIGNHVKINKGNIIGEEAIIDSSVILKNSFYKKTIKSNLTYCGNGNVSIGCQIFKVDFWLKHYNTVAKKFDYSKKEINECLVHMKHIKNNS